MEIGVRVVVLEGDRVEVVGHVPHQRHEGHALHRDSRRGDFHRGKGGDADDNFSLFDGVKCLVVLSFTNIQEEIAGKLHWHHE